VTFIYLIDLTTLEDLWPSWPRDMRVAVCMSPGDRFDAILHHKDETEGVPERLARLRNIDPRSIVVAPEIPGYPTLKVFFSEERTILKALLETEGILDAAFDYQVNFDFARDEGLDPDKVTGMARDLSLPGPAQ
jgi:hypothetical protein